MERQGAVVAGLICLDIIPSIAHGNLADTLTPGQTVEVGPITFHTGGAVANTGIALHRLGIPTRLVGLVGNDTVGETIRHLVQQEAESLAEGLTTVPGAASPCTLVLSPPGGDRAFITHPGTNHTFSANDIPDDLLRGARLFHFGYPPYMRRMYVNEGQELVDVFRRARDCGVITSLDLAFPEPNGASGQVDWPSILRRTLPFVDLFLPSADELLFMLRRGLCPSVPIPVEVITLLADETLAMGATVVALKAGDRGLYVRTGGRLSEVFPPIEWQNRELWAPCFAPQPLVGTTGAGDATIAGFLAALLRGLPLESALTMAVAVGACCVEMPDAVSGIRAWSEIEARIMAGWPRAHLEIQAPGWHWDDAQHLWSGPHDRVHSHLI